MPLERALSIDSVGPAMLSGLHCCSPGSGFDYQAPAVANKGKGFFFCVWTNGFNQHRTALYCRSTALSEMDGWMDGWMEGGGEARHA